ncbi:TolC family protein [Parasediminibacterium sp. JCM 36343]|uniref:TolC family protein n=1 Tax=Parasediminibacterium sp. JCM 36343 TaxID=3374279 RepID=UPI00397E88C7
MKKILTILFISTTILVAVEASAQEAANTELKSFINHSFSYFPRIKEVENTVITAKQKVDLSGINTPTVDGNATYRFVEPKIQVPIGGAEFQFAPIHNLDGNVSANYLLYDFGRIKANVEKAKTELKYAEHNVLYAKFQLASQVTNIYYNIIYLQHAISIQDSVLSFLGDNKTFIENKYKNGDALKIDVLNIQTQIDAEENRKVDLQNNLQKQQNLLGYTTGKKETEGNTFDFEIPMKDVASALADAQASNPDFALAKDKVKQAESDVAIAKLGTKPSINVGAATGLKNGYVPAVNEIKFNYNAGVALKIPIYEGGKTKKQAQLSQTLVKQNELAIATLSSTYKKDLEQALTDLLSNLRRIHNTQGQIEAAKYATSLAATRFKNGVGTNLELTNASTNLQRAELTKLQYQYQLCLAKVEMARLMGYQYW